MARRKGSSASRARARKKAAKEGSKAKVESSQEDECDQLTRECWELDLKRVELSKKERELEEEKRRLEEQLEEQLRPLRREVEQMAQDWRSKRNLVEDLCRAREVENAQRLGKLPQEVWEKIFDHLENDLFPLALSCRYFRQKQKELVERTEQSGKPRLALKTHLDRKFDGRQPPSADYLRFCSKEEGSKNAGRKRDAIIRRLAAFHGHLSLLQELLKPFKSSEPEITKGVFFDVANAAGGSPSSQSLLLRCFGF